MICNNGKGVPMHDNDTDTRSEHEHAEDTIDALDAFDTLDAFDAAYTSIEDMEVADDA